MKKKHSTNDEFLVSIPSPISSDGKKVDIKKITLDSLVASTTFSKTEKANEISQRHPQNTFNSLLVWTEGMELAARLHSEDLFPYSKEKEVIQVIFQLTPMKAQDLNILRQITKNDWLPANIKDSAKRRFEQLTKE